MAYISASDLKAYMGITSSSDDTQLGLACTRAQSVVEGYTNRVFEWAGAATIKYFTPINEKLGGQLADDGRTLYTFGFDILEVSSITNGDGNNIPTNAIVTLPLNVTPGYAIRIKSNTSYVWTFTGSPDAAIAISAKWAYTATPPAEVIAATLRIASYLYRQREGTPDTDRAIMSADGVVLAAPKIPTDATMMLQAYRRRL